MQSMSSSIETHSPELLYAMGLSAMEKVQREAIDPDIIIGPGQHEGEPDYLRRWYILRHRDDEGCIYLHRFGRSDSDRALHDHPWPWTTVILQGAYQEYTPEGNHYRTQGDVVSRKATDFHRVRLVTPGVWTLFMTGKKERDWGFLLPDGGWMESSRYFEQFG